MADVDFQLASSTPICHIWPQDRAGFITQAFLSHGVLSGENIKSSRRSGQRPANTHGHVLSHNPTACAFTHHVHQHSGSSLLFHDFGKVAFCVPEKRAIAHGDLKRQANITTQPTCLRRAPDLRFILGDFGAPAVAFLDLSRADLTLCFESLQAELKRSWYHIPTAAEFSLFTT